MDTGERDIQKMEIKPAAGKHPAAAGGKENMLPIRTFEPGEILRMRDPIIKLEKGAPPAKPVEVEVVKQYPHHLMVKSRKGTRWCITNAEIMTAMIRKAEDGKIYDKHGELAGIGKDG